MVLRKFKEKIEGKCQERKVKKLIKFLFCLVVYVKVEREKKYIVEEFTFPTLPHLFLRKTEREIF